MDPQSSSSASSSMSRRNYDAFLSFRGVDTRYTFISHLYRALCQKGVYTFKDSEELEAGQRRSELFDAIEGSRIAVVTFSENYARSKWCLDELQKIMECKGQGKMVVIPIFYRVSPREVRLHEKENGEKGCYQIAMEEMETKYGRDPKTMERWRKALWEGGDLIGFEFGIGKDEGAVVQDVVDMVMNTVNREYLEVAKHPIGIGSHLRAIRPSLHMDPHVDDVFMVGILGQGGVGKTTLSKAICNDIADRFDDWCFLPNVREMTSRVNGLEQLQQKLLHKLLGKENLLVSSVDSGKEMIKDRLSKKRVLVILDDVEESVQLDALAGDLNWFGKGSRIILTTRNEHVLTARGVPLYKVNLLEWKEAENLFRRHAFDTQEKINIDCGLINRFVNYSGRLPLALVVLGAFLHGRSESEWKGKLKELKGSPDEAINRVLKISYDGLEKNHKEIFLDVACFFKGRHINKVEKILDGCGFAASLGLAILKERCLITIVNGRIEMHDLLVEMGQSIVRDKGNGIPNRIWLYEDFRKITSDERSAQERQAAEGIVLDLRHNDHGIIKYNTFKDFKKLRILILYEDFFFGEEPLQLPRELRWLELSACSLLAMEFYPSSELVHLELRYCKIQQLKAMGLEKLKYMSLSKCPSVETLPDLSRCRDLEVLKLSSCNKLTGLDEAIGSLENLVELKVEECRNLAMVPSSLRSKHLQTLHFCKCPNLKKIPANMEKLEFLKELYLNNNFAVKELPDTIGNLVALKTLHLSYCMELMVIPSSIYKMQALKELKLEYCRKLSGFPRRAAGAATDVQGFPNLVSLHITYCKLKDVEFLDDLTCHKTLMSLHLSGNEFTQVPASISKLRNLQVLRLDRCFQLVEVSELPNIPYLNVAECEGKRAFRLTFAHNRKLDSGYIINRWLSLENVRQSVGAISVVFPGVEFPNWVKFNSGEWNSFNRVFLPRDMLVDDLFGLALFICFGSVGSHVGFFRIIVVRVNGVDIFHECPEYVRSGNHCWWVYIPWQSLIQGDGDLTPELNGLDITLQIPGVGGYLYPMRWGMHLVCKREEDEVGIKVFKDGDDNDVTIQSMKIKLTRIMRKGDDKDDKDEDDLRGGVKPNDDKDDKDEDDLGGGVKPNDGEKQNGIKGICLTMFTTILVLFILWNWIHEINE